MDRTKLFFELIAAYENQRGQTRQPLASLGQGASSVGAFTRAAAEVGRELHSTAAKVQQLTKRESWESLGPLKSHWDDNSNVRRIPSFYFAFPPFFLLLTQWCAAVVCLTHRAAETKQIG